MFENTRRGFMRGIGASATGAAALGLTGNTQASISDEPLWTVNNTVEGRNTVVASMEVGYFGSQLVDRFIRPGVSVERWVHNIDISFVATCTENAPNIQEQRFETRFHGDTEHRGVLLAGSAEWPDPPGGNWGAVLDVVLEESVSSLSSFANLILTAGDIKEAYEEESFDLNSRDRIEFETNYREWRTRETCSHSVSFEADQPPHTDGMIDILGEVNDQGFDTGAFVYLYPEHDGIPNHFPAVSTTNTPVMDRLDEMSEEELERRGILRIPNEVSLNSRVGNIDTTTDRPTYVTKFEPNVEFEAKNGETVNSSVTTD